MFDFAPDELHKANNSGSTHDIDLSEPVADPFIHGVGVGPTPPWSSTCGCPSRGAECRDGRSPPTVRLLP